MRVDSREGRRTVSRGWRLAGPTAVVLWIGGTLVSTLLFPGFSWTSNTLAEVGTAGRPSAPVFDVSVVAGSVLGVLFLALVWRRSANHYQRAGVGVLGILFILIGAAQVGLQNPWLELIALAVILVTLPALALYGTGAVLAGRHRLGLWSIWLGIGHLLAWQVLSIILGFSSAIPTFVTLVLLSGWVLLHYSRFRRDTSLESTAG